jgi:hypothetical protein
MGCRENHYRIGNAEAYRKVNFEDGNISVSWWSDGTKSGAWRYALRESQSGPKLWQTGSFKTLAAARDAARVVINKRGW